MIDFWVRWKNTIKHSVNTVAVGSVAYIHFALPAGSKAGAILAGKAGAGAAAVSATFTGAAAVIATTAAAAVPPVAIGVGLTVLSYKFGKWVKSTRKSEKAKPDVEPFPFGDGRPNESFMSFRYFATESADPGNKEFILTWTKKDESVLNQSQGGPEKRQGKNDKDPDCRDCIPNTPEDINQLHALIKTLSELLRDIRRNEPTLIQSPSKSEIFAMLLDLIKKLIHTHGAVFQRSEAGIRLIPFRIDQVRRALVQNPPDLFFDQPIRDFFSTVLTPINDSNNTLNAFKNIKGLIYCIQCQICQQPNVFNYVGQTVQLVAKRGGKHYRVIKKNAGHLLHSHLLNKHGITNIKGILSEAYKIYLIHDLSDNATSPRADPSCERGTDKRIRRSWEMFYQWLYRAMDFDGGGCHM